MTDVSDLDSLDPHNAGDIALLVANLEILQYKSLIIKNGKFIDKVIVTFATTGGKLTATADDTHNIYTQILPQQAEIPIINLVSKAGLSFNVNAANGIEINPALGSGSGGSGSIPFMPSPFPDLTSKIVLTNQAGEQLHYKIVDDIIIIPLGTKEVYIQMHPIGGANRVVFYKSINITTDPWSKLVGNSGDPSRKLEASHYKGRSTPIVIRVIEGDTVLSTGTVVQLLDTGASFSRQQHQTIKFRGSFNIAFAENQKP